MKKLIATCLVMTMLVLSVNAYDLWFTWKANPATESVTSYVIEQATLPNTNFIAVVTIPGTTNVGVVRGLSNKSYQFRIVAKNGVGTSSPSSILSYPTNAPTTVTNFQFTTPR